MEDKQYLDEAGLGEVGKVISKFYANKEDIKDLDSLKDFVDKNNSMSFCFVTQEEWQSLDDDSRRFFITKTNDPYLIVALESKPNSKEKFGIFDDDPVWIFNDIELNKGEEKHGQPYLIVNLPTSAELNFNWFDKNGATGATYQYKIQLALGLRDYVAYYQIVEAIDGEIKYTNWSCLNDMYSRQWIDKLKAELGKMETKINHIDSKVADRAHKSYIVNNLIAGGTNKVLSAEQGKVLNENKAPKINTIVVASYNSSDDSKQKADYVIQENECVGEKIQQIITAMPNSGGTIQLTDGKFIIKNHNTLSLSKPNVSIVGCGFDTKISITAIMRTEPIIVLNSRFCSLKNLEVLHSDGVGVILSGNDGTVENVRIINVKYDDKPVNSLLITNKGYDNRIINVQIKTNDNEAMSVQGHHNLISRCCSYNFQNGVFIGGISVNGDCNIVEYFSGNHVDLKGKQNAVKVSRLFGADTSMNVSGNNNFVSQCYGATAGKTNIFINGINNTIQGCLFYNHSDSDGSIYALTTTSTGNTISDCHGIAPSTAMSFDIQGINNSISNCIAVANHNKGYAISGKNNSITGCSCSDSVVGFHVAGNQNTLIGSRVFALNKPEGTGIIVEGSQHIISNNNLPQYSIDGTGDRCIVVNNIVASSKSDA